MRTVRLSYPHLESTLEPARLTAPEIWAIATEARRHLCPHPRRPRVELAGLIARTRKLEVNDCAIETRWELGQDVVDDRGRIAYGPTEHDPSSPGSVVIHLHTRALGEAEDLIRSTALHELAHVIFDAPSWVAGARDSSEGGDTPSPPRRLHTEAVASRMSGHVDWPEWRANEFMGGFLAPRHLLHDWAVKRAACLGLKLVDPSSGNGLPLIACAYGDARDRLAFELAELFGLSDRFIATRLRRYGIVRLPREGA